MIAGNERKAETARGFPIVSQLKGLPVTHDERFSDQTWHGRQIVAARALAGLSVKALAGAAGISPHAVRKLEASPAIDPHASDTAPAWGKVTGALAAHGVELSASGSFVGLGVRWVRPSPAGRRSHLQTEALNGVTQ